MNFFNKIQHGTRLFYLKNLYTIRQGHSFLMNYHAYSSESKQPASVIEQRPAVFPLCYIVSLSYLSDHIESRVGNQCLRDADAFGGLVVFKQGGDDTRQGQCASV